MTVSGQTTQLVYDGDGNLVKKIKPDGSKTIFVGGLYEVDKNSGGTVTKTTVYYPAAGAMRVNGTLYYMLKDHLGSSSVVTDSTGAVVGEQRYYPFGETRLATGSMYTDKLFTGQRAMADLGIYHYQSRFYSPKLGRFLSADTLVPNAANPQDFNRYAYVRNNPVRYTDPSGHFICSNDRNSDDYCPGRTSNIGSNASSGGGGYTPPCTRNCGGGGGGGTPTITTTPIPSCTSPTNACATSNAEAQVTPTITLTPTQSVGICGENMNCSAPTAGPTGTPFAQDIVVPAVERGVGLLNPFAPSFDPIDAQQIWDTVLHVVPPIFGFAPSNFTSAVDYVVSPVVNVITNVITNVASTVSTVFETGIGITLPIFILPSDNFLFPTSPPAGSA